MDFLLNDTLFVFKSILSDVMIVTLVCAEHVHRLDTFLFVLNARSVKALDHVQEQQLIPLAIVHHTFPRPGFSVPTPSRKIECRLTCSFLFTIWCIAPRATLHTSTTDVIALGIRPIDTCTMLSAHGRNEVSILGIVAERMVAGPPSFTLTTEICPTEYP